MYSVLLFTIIGALLAFRLVWINRDRSYWGWEDYFIPMVLGVIAGAFIGCIIGLCMPSKTEVKYSKTNIVCLQDESGLSGRFFLGSGNIEGRMRYVFYSDNGDSTYRMQQLDYDIVSIKYTSQQPAVIKRYVTLTEDFINHFTIHSLNHLTRFTIEVPKGTINANYNLDAK
jgi:hypothetical protein